MPKVRLRDLNPAIFLHSVGIGTDEPAYMLDVVGGNVRIGKTTNGRLDIENNSGVRKILLDSNGNSYINGGNVGIGTGETVSSKFHVRGGSLRVDSESGYNQFGTIELFGTNGGAFGGSYIARSKIESISDGTAYGSHFLFHTNDTSNNYQERLRITSDGKVGINTNSFENSTGKLFVGGEVMNSAAVAQFDGFIRLKQGLYISDSSTPTNYVGWDIKNNSLVTHAGGNGTHKVGIGTGSSTLNSKLTVAGNSDGGDSECAIHIIDNDSTIGSSVPSISFRSGASTQIYGIRANDVLGLTFRNSSDATKITFDNDGNIGVGIYENISAKLQVEGGRIKVRQSNSYSGLSIAHESGGHAYFINSDNTYMTFMVGGSVNSNKILTLQDDGIDLNRETHFRNGTRRLHPRNGSHPIIETVFNLNNHNSSSAAAFNIADITRDINNWGYGHYLVEIHANYYSGGSYSRYYISYAASTSTVHEVEKVGTNLNDYNVRLAGETTLSGNVKKASIMVDVAAYGNATVKLTHCGVSVDTNTLSHSSGHIKYNI